MDLLRDVRRQATISCYASAMESPVLSYGVSGYQVALAAEEKRDAKEHEQFQVRVHGPQTAMEYICQGLLQFAFSLSFFSLRPENFRYDAEMFRCGVDVQRELARAKALLRSKSGQRRVFHFMKCQEGAGYFVS